MNAALYWLARLIEGGADPIFIARRLCILASEDVGLADPQAMVQAAAAAQITRADRAARSALPALAGDRLSGARAEVERRQARLPAAAEDAAETAREPVPLHLRNAVTPLMKRVGYGTGLPLRPRRPGGARGDGLPARAPAREKFIGRTKKVKAVNRESSIVNRRNRLQRFTIHD